jgi:Tfp pilus assembly major pilin PilA
LAKAITRNRLGLPIEKKQQVDSTVSDNNAKTTETAAQSESIVELEARLKKKYQEDLKAHSKNLIEEHKLRLSSLKVEAQDQLEKIQANYRAERSKLNDKVESIKQFFNEEKQKNIQLKKTLEAQADSVKEVRERFFAELEKNKEVSQDRLLELEEKYELEAQANLDAVTAELKERLDMREVELFYRDEQIKRLNEETVQLRKEKQDLIDNRGDRLLQNLVKSGITFVAYQPGVDHLNIPLSEMSDYLESPIAYVADKCSVDKELYQQWLAHNELPVCNHSGVDGICGRPIPKVDKPSRFIVGENDRCSEHNRAANT